MFQRPILMNEEGASPGGGAPQQPVSPTANQGAPVAAPASAEILSVVAQQLAEFKNGFFADLRKAGALKSETKPSPTVPAPAPVPMEAPAAQTISPGMTASDVQTMLARQRAFDRAVGSAGLTDDQIATVETVFQAVNPPDPHAWASGFIKTMGIGRTNATPQPATTIEQAPAQAPAPPATPASNFSDKGPAASSVARDPMAIIQNDPRKATMDDFRRLAAQHGQAKALQMWTDNTMAFLQTVKVRPDGRR